MHICHIITRLIIGGAQENTILTCEGLHERGHEVTLISGPTTGPEGNLVGRVRAGRYRFIEIPELIRRVNPWYDARAQRMIEWHLTQLKPDVVHTHSSKAGIVGRFAAARAGVPAIMHTIHGMSFNRTQSWPVRTVYAFLERRAAKVTDVIVTVADAMIEQSVAARIAPREKHRTVYSGMEIAPFTPGKYDRKALRAAWGFSDDAIVVGTVARFFRQKGYEQLIPIMAAAVKREPRMRFVWVGDGAQGAEYDAELTRLGLRDRTHWTGLVPPERVAELLAGVDILAHTSQWEGLPRVVVQAALMQIPSVAFAIDGTPEVVIDGETGRCVPLNDFGAFVSAIVELAGNAEERRRLGARGRERCLEDFDSKTMVDGLERIYLELESRHGAT